MLADDVLTDLAVDLLELVRGDEKARFAERVARAGAVARLHQRLRRGNVRGRVLAAAALANFHDEETQEALTEALDDRNPRVGRVAALSLAATGKSPAPKEVIRRLRISEHEASLLIVMLLVGMAQSDVESVRSLLLDPDTSEDLKAATAEALALCNDVAAVPDISRLAMDADPGQANCLAIWRHLPISSILPVPRPSYTGSMPPRLRYGLPQPAQRDGSGSSRPSTGLSCLLDDADWWVRFQAAHALLRYGEEGQRRLNLAAARNEEPARETASLTLAEQAEHVCA